MAIHPLTKRQREILDFLTTEIGRNGFAPSLEEIGHRFGLSGLATVHQHLSNLQEKGYIWREWNRSRSITIVKFDRCPYCRQLVQSEPIANDPRESRTT